MMRKAVLSFALIAVLSTAGFAADITYTWSGLSGTSTNWSDAANWDVVPTSATSTHIVFPGGPTQLGPTLDSVLAPYGSYLALNSMAFTSTAGAYVLGGTVLAPDGVTPVPTAIRMRANGTVMPIISKVAGSSDIIIHNAVIANSAATNYLQVDSGSLTIDGGMWGGNAQTVEKTGAGTAYVNQFGLTYSPVAQSNVGPRYKVDDGTLVIGSKTLKYWNTSTLAWVDNTTPIAGYGQTIGDGIGAADSAILRIDSASSNTVFNPLGGSVGVTINSDGWFDANGKSLDFGTTTLTINGGHFTSGQAIFRTGTTSKVIMTGGTINTGTAEFWMYNGTTFQTLAAANGATANVTCGNFRMPGGGTNLVTFDVADTAGADVDLNITGNFGGGYVAECGFTKTGAGTMRLASNSVYNGVTNINAGRVIMDGANTGQGNVTVNFGGTLGGSGSLGLAAAVASPATPAAKLVVNGGGILAPGGLSGPGTFTVGRSTVADTTTTLGDGGASNASLAIRISSTAADQLILNTSAASTITSNLILNGATLDLNFLNGFIPATGASYTIVDNQAPATIGVTGTFANAAGNKLHVTLGGHDCTFDVSYAGGDGNDVVLSNFIGASTPIPALTASPLTGTAVDFGKLHPLTGTMGAVTNPGPVNLSNTGDAGSTLSITADVTGTNASLFHVSNPVLPKVLNAGAGAQPFDLLFDGGAPGIYTATVTFTGDNGQTASYPVTATVLYQGDANEDGKVSFADYIALANNFGQTGAAWTMGDFNGDGKVSFADYILLANNFGQHVPEPATLGLLLIGGLGLIRRNRK